MLKSLYIKNLAIITELKVEFDDGLNIITGETGAGKSLIIKAIQFLLGKRFSPEVLRTGSNTLIIEGEFEKDNSQIVIRRLYRKNGQSKSFINDEPVKQIDLIKTTRMLADLHGQHDQQNLLDSNTHLKYLDSFGSYNIELNKVEQLFQKTEFCKKTLNKLVKQQQEFDEKEELYEFQLKELILHPISFDLEKEMTNKYNLLSKATDIKASLSNASSLLEDGDSAVIKKLNAIMSELDKVSDYGDSIMGLYKRVDSNRIDLEDLILEIRRVQENIVVNTDELERINEVISHIEMLKRKYGGSIESVIEYKEKIIQSEKDSGNCKDDIQKLEIELEDISKHLNNYAEKLSQNRNKTAARLGSIIKRNLENLNMPDIQFEINLSTDPDNMQETGMDSCEFFISTNIGEELRPVVKIASGGEISRIMLAIKMALQSKDIVDTLIFDEIDLGISGATAERVGETFEKLSESHQILCITHLSQIAGKGRSHYKVSKEEKNNRIVAEINKLSESDRIREIATLISGLQVTESSRRQAKELLQFNG